MLLRVFDQVAILHRVIGGMVPHELYCKVVNGAGQNQLGQWHTSPLSPSGSGDALQSQPRLAENEIFSHWNELCRQSVIAADEETAQLLSCSNELVDWDDWIKQQVKTYSPIPYKLSPALVHDLFGAAI